MQLKKQIFSCILKIDSSSITVHFMPLCLRDDCLPVLFCCNFCCTADDKCATVPPLKQSECSGLSCRGLPIKTRRKIKCLPFSPSGSRGLWCDRINSFFCGGGTCNLSCFEVFKNSSNQIYSPSSTENSIFEVEHCRCFEIVIGAKYLGTFVYGRKNVFFF